jgi:hypothetical protein
MPDSRLSKRGFRRRGLLRRMSAKPPATISVRPAPASEEGLRPAAAVPGPARARHEAGTPTGGLRPEVALDRLP